jgi:MFS family permease
MDEWRRFPMLPIAGAVGHAAGIAHVYGFSAYIGPISQEFGWSRTLTTIGLTIVMLVQAAGAIPVGILVDKLGSRKIGLVGLLLAPLGFALLGTATGAESNWILLWFVMAFLALPVQSTIWASAVATRFHASRGLALAVAMCGGSLANALFPWLGAFLILRFGWEAAMPYQAAIMVAVTFPFMFLFFRGARDGVEGSLDDATIAEKMNNEPGMTLKQGIRSTIYQRLLLCGILYTFVVPPLSVHFLVIQTDGGIDPIRAAQITGLIGVSSIIGRVTTGFLIDRVNAAAVGAIAFLMPAIACGVLLAGGVNIWGAAFAAVLLGLTQGAEIDIFGYLTAKYFGLRNFGSLFGGMLLSLSVGTALGPLAASQLFDISGDYSLFLWGSIACVLLCSTCFATLPRPRLIEAAG